MSLNYSNKLKIPNYIENETSQSIVDLILGVDSSSDKSALLKTDWLSIGVDEDCPYNLEPYEANATLVDLQFITEYLDYFRMHTPKYGTQGLQGVQGIQGIQGTTGLGQSIPMISIYKDGIKFPWDSDQYIEECKDIVDNNLLVFEIIKDLLKVTNENVSMNTEGKLEIDYNYNKDITIKRDIKISSGRIGKSYNGWFKY